MTRILPCPFCGRRPDIVPVRGGALIIERVNALCISPRVSHYSRAAAIRAWNRRNGVDLECIERDQQLIRNRGRV
jgi:hypothetical protein